MATPKSRLYATDLFYTVISKVLITLLEINLGDKTYRSINEMFDIYKNDIDNIKNSISDLYKETVSFI